MNFELLAIIALALATVPALMFLWNLPQLRSPQPTSASSQERNLCSGIRKIAPLPGGARGASAETAESLRLSVLIPARNESANIRGALTSVLANHGAKFEVIVLDDHSSDDTSAIVREFAACDTRVRLEQAPPLPSGWCGKQHACHVLAQHANHSLLVFMDADVRLSPDALARMSGFMTRDRVLDCGGPTPLAPALASGVPRQLTGTFLEKLLIPLIHFVLLGFLPVWRMRRCNQPAYGAGCGQLFIARANAYHAMGGHAAIRDSLHDGLKLPRAFRRAGYPTDLFDATDIATCRMYRNAQEVVDGLTKNAHEGLAAPAQIGPWTVLLFGGQVLPWLLLAGSHWLNNATLLLALAGAGLTLLPRLLAAWRFQQSWLGALLHPVGVWLFLAIQWRAFRRSFRHQPQTWKGRSYRASPEATTAPPPRPRTVPVRSA